MTFLKLFLLYSKNQIAFTTLAVWLSRAALTYWLSTLSTEFASKTIFSKLYDSNCFYPMIGIHHPSLHLLYYTVLVHVWCDTAAHKLCQTFQFDSRWQHTNHSSFIMPLWRGMGVVCRDNPWPHNIIYLRAYIVCCLSCFQAQQFSNSTASINMSHSVSLIYYKLYISLI